MANIVKNCVDTRTFPAICSTLTDMEWLELKRRLMTQLMKTEQTILNWKNGKTFPTDYSVRKEATSIVNRFLGIKTSHLTLFDYERARTS